MSKLRIGVIRSLTGNIDQVRWVFQRVRHGKLIRKRVEKGEVGKTKNFDFSKSSEVQSGRE